MNISALGSKHQFSFTIAIHSLYVNSENLVLDHSLESKVKKRKQLQKITFFYSQLTQPSHTHNIEHSSVCSDTLGESRQ